MQSTHEGLEMSELGLVVSTEVVPVEQPITVNSLPEDQNSLHPDTLSDLRAQLIKTETHIDNYNNALQTAQLVHAQLRQAINEQLKTHSFIQTIPPEVLGHIFWFYTRLGLESNGPFQVFATAIGPWPLAQVCRKWRTIVWDTPRLWSSFSLDWKDFDDIPRNLQPGAITLFTDMFARTKQIPLAVKIDFQYDLWLDACCDLVAREARRLEELVLNGTPFQLRDRLSTLFRWLPALKSLTLIINRKHSTSRYPEDDDKSGSVAFVPQLTRLYLCCQGRLPSRIAPPLPYAQLRHLEVSFHQNVSLPFTLSALAQCTNLETFRDLSYYPRHDVPSVQRDIALNQLKAVSIKSPSLLSSFTAPALALLLLPLNYNWSRPGEDLERMLNPICDLMKAFQERSQCRIDAAFLLPIPPGNACRKFLRGFSHLRTLAINAWEEGESTSSFISLLKRDPEETFMPQLDTLNVCLSATPHLRCLSGLQPEVLQDTAIEAALTQVIASRRNVPPNRPMLQAVNIIYICPGWDYDIDVDDMFTAATATTFYKTLRDFEREGLALCVDFLARQQYSYWDNAF